MTPKSEEDLFQDRARQLRTGDTRDFLFGDNDGMPVAEVYRVFGVL
ncbi:MAG: hypothetical protein ABIQ99_11660 [Thermoflexales bacterium]